MALTQILNQRELEKFAQSGGQTAVKVLNPDGTNIGTVSGGVGALYVSTATTYVSGASTSLYTDVNGNLLVTLATLLAGEDLTNNVLKVEERFSYAALTSLATSTVKSGAGFLHSITVGMPSCPTISVYDSTVPSGTLIHKFAAGTPIGTYMFDETFLTGLTVDSTSSGVVPMLNFSYR